MRREAVFGPLCSWLQGFGVALVVIALAVRSQTMFGESPARMGTLVAAALTALGIGIAMPRHFAVWACLRVWRGISQWRKGEAAAVPNISPTGLDRALLGHVWAALLLAGGGATVLSAGFAVIGAGAVEFLDRSFVWSAPLVPLLQFGMGWLLALIPLGLLGMAVACGHLATGPAGVWNVSVTGWHFIGAGFGIFGAGRWMPISHGGVPALLMAALPSLLAALLVAVTAPTPAKAAAGPPPDARLLPSATDERTWLVRAVVAGLAVVIAGFIGWMSEHTIGEGGHWSSVLPSTVCLLGLGLVAGSRSDDDDPVRVTTVGWMLGMMAFSLGILLLVYGSVPPGESMKAGLPWFAVLIVFGLSWAKAQEAVLQRVAHRSSEGAGLLGRSVVRGAVLAPVLLFLAGMFMPPFSVLILLTGCLVVAALTVLASECGEWGPQWGARFRGARISGLLTAFRGSSRNSA